jgi:arylsulfatase A
VIAPFAPRNLALRSGRWIYINGQGDGGFGGVRGGPGSVAFSQRTNSDITAEGKIRPDAPPAQLYDLEADPEQAKNVIREHPEIATRLAALLAEHRATARTAPIP